MNNVMGLMAPSKCFWVMCCSNKYVHMGNRATVKVDANGQ